MRPRQASELACLVLAGTREGLVSPRSSSVAAPSDPVGSILVEILHLLKTGT